MQIVGIYKLGIDIETIYIIHGIALPALYIFRNKIAIFTHSG